MLSPTPLHSWTGDLTQFPSAFEALPEAEHQLVNWEGFCTLLAPEQPVVNWNKSRVSYFIPSLLREAPFVAETKKKADRLGWPLIGKQRSRNHVTTASALISEIDGISDDELARIEYGLVKAAITYLIYSTHSYGRSDKPSIRVRIVIPLDRPMGSTEYAAAAAGFNELALNGKADTSGFKLCQQQGAWATSPDRLHLAFKRMHRAGVANASTLIAAAPAAVMKAVPAISSDQPVIFDRDRIRQALKRLSPESYEDWVNTGLWLKAAYGDAAFPEWLVWSNSATEVAKNQNNDGSYTPEAKWATLDPCTPPSAGAGKLFQAAKLQSVDTVRRAIVSADWNEDAKDALLYLRIHHPKTYDKLVGGAA